MRSATCALESLVVRLRRLAPLTLPLLFPSFGLRGVGELTPWVTTADLDAFPDALRGELPEPRGVREKLERYEWHRIAGEARSVYEKLAAARPNR